MTFDNIIKDSHCNCLADTYQDNGTYFARVLSKEVVADKDFLSKWDKGNTSEDCEEACGLKGVSVSKIENDDIKEQVITLYSQIFKLSPKYRRGVLLFKFKVDAGLIKHSPDQHNKYHHDFYKVDGFNMDLIEQSAVEFLKPAANV